MRITLKLLERRALEVLDDKVQSWIYRLTQNPDGEKANEMAQRLLVWLFDNADLLKDIRKKVAFNVKKEEKLMRKARAAAAEAAEAAKEEAEAETESESEAEAETATDAEAEPETEEEIEIEIQEEEGVEHDNE